jgi:glycosyltransferase involved in cell wall biosynthesis
MVGTSLAGRGGVVAAVTAWRDGGVFEREAVRYVATHADGTRMVKLRHALGGLYQTLAACLLRRPAIVHAHSASRASFVRKSLLLLVARRAGCQTIFHLHGGAFRQFVEDESGPLKRRWIRHTLEHSARVIALSDGWATYLAGFAPRARVAVLPNAVAVPKLPDPQLEQPGRILFLGRLEAAKGIDELLQAVARLAPRFAQLTLALGGEGDMERVRERARALGIGDRVELLGWMGPEARDAELARAAVFCLPSHAEGLPMSMLEAMAAGRAVVVSSVGGIPETIHDNDNGLLVPPRDVDALSAALERVLGEPALRAHLAQRARATIEAQYSLAVVGERLASLYRELAGAQ